MAGPARSLHDPPTELHLDISRSTDLLAEISAVLIGGRSIREYSESARAFSEMTTIPYHSPRNGTVTELFSRLDVERWRRNNLGPDAYTDSYVIDSEMRPFEPFLMEWTVTRRPDQMVVSITNLETIRYHGFPAISPGGFTVSLAIEDRGTHCAGYGIAAVDSSVLARLFRDRLRVAMTARIEALVSWLFDAAVVQAGSATLSEG